MAEIVSLRTEEMIPELEHLLRSKIFNDAEIRCIVKQRNRYQYKIQRKKKCVEDFIHYIMYEMDLMRMVKNRKVNLGLQQKGNDLEMVIAHRINKLFEQAIFRFHDDIHLWLSYMKFCKQVRAYRLCVSNMLVGMLSVHCHKPSLWKLAATWELEENNSIENACQFLMRGLRHHPNSKLLYLEAFRMHLVYANMKLKGGTELSENEVEALSGTANLLGPNQVDNSIALPVMEVPEDGCTLVLADADEGIPDPVVDLQTVEYIYNTAREKVATLQFHISLLNVAKDFSFTRKLQFKIMKEMLNKYSDNEETWNYLARCECEGVFFSDSPPTPEEFLKVGNQSLLTDEEKVTCLRLSRSVAIFQRGIATLRTKKMCLIYIDFLIELLEDPSMKKLKRSLLNTALNKAHDRGYLEEKYYLQWIEIGKKKRTPHVLSMATEKCPTSVELWQSRLKYYLMEGNEKHAEKLFKQAKVALGAENAETIILWKTMIQYYQTKSNVKVRDYFKDAIKQGPAVSTPMKEMYLEWLAMTKNVTVVRQVYQTLCDKTPVCFEVHRKMAAIESLQPHMDLKKVIKCFERACLQCSKDPDVWLEYIKFLVRENEKNKVKEIYLRALKALDEVHAHKFLGDFCVLSCQQ